MPIHTKELDNLSINTIRFLAVDAVQKANSGHPGMPMGCAPIAYSLYSKIMKHNPANPLWLNRDRFILSAGHGSMLLYASLHLCGYKVSMDDLKNFRQWGSITPGHPEYHITPGVETTTGPLGQGFANAVGMAIANAYLSSLFNKDDLKILDHYIFGICSDGDLMEGISHEAASLAGHLKLNRLIFFYDDNKITIDGSTDLAFSEDVQKRFEAYGWNTLRIGNGNNVDDILSSVEKAKQSDKPTLILTRTIIGFGSPNKSGSEESHGSPLGKDEVTLTKQNLDWKEDAEFYIPAEVKDLFNEVKLNGEKYETEWNELFEKYENKFPDDAKLFKNVMSRNFGELWKKKLPVFAVEPKGIATRAASGKILNAIADVLPTLIGGSADLSPSNNTFLKNFDIFSAGNNKGRNLHFGVREHAMAGALNGMAIYGGVIPYAGTFLIFSDYMKPSIRLAALSRIKPIFIFSHDSVGLGEDGPTHQPVEQIAALRAIPGVTVIRPADANETIYAWQAALEHKDGPAAILLTRQNVPVLDQSKFPSAEGLLKGAYILKDSEVMPDVILMATGSEVHPALEAAEKLELEGINARVVSFPSWELFEKQPEEYKEEILPSNVKARLSIEAGVKLGWERYTGEIGDGVSIEMFGHSAPGNIVLEKYGFTGDNIYNSAKRVLGKISEGKVNKV
jgi:transketolase